VPLRYINCKIIIKIGNSFSALHSVVSGVVQGSVLGPILFVLFVNDICDLASLGVTIKLFADGTIMCLIMRCRLIVYSLVCQLYLPGRSAILLYNRVGACTGR